MLRPHAVIRLKIDKAEEGLKAGMEGTIMYAYTLNHVDYDYDVEFTDGEGNTVALVQLPEDEVELVEYPPNSI